MTGWPTGNEVTPFEARHCVRSMEKLIVLAGLAGASAAESTNQSDPGGGPKPPLVPAEAVSVEEGFEYEEVGHWGESVEPTVVEPGVGAVA